MCERTVFLNCQGEKIIALGSGNPADLSVTSCEKITLFSGKALAIIKKNHSDDIELQATFQHQVKESLKGLFYLVFTS